MATSRFVLAGRTRSARLAYVPALVELRLPQGFHDLSPDEQKRAIEESMGAAFEQAMKAIGQQVAGHVAAA